LAKGVLYLLKALADLRIPSFEVVLIGGLAPEIAPFLAQYEGTYRYIGFKPRTELYRYYSQGSVLIQPSVQEGLSLVLGQAMACGLPVIASGCTGVEELISDGVEGFIVPARDPGAIQDRVVYLYENPQVREQMSCAALQRIRSLGGWNSYGRRAIEIYQQLLHGDGALPQVRRPEVANVR
jgi:glycosyltransferase involved in cell wall biosynthesis